uniref:Plac8 onzin related protein 6 n=1 Tax=Sinocyclocheilus anshuiensis TaxID=1608454 RepID=A0A671M9M4_9TELE
IATNMIFQQPQFSPVTAVSSIQWNTGICGCFDDCNVCDFSPGCFAIWCPLCFTCSTASDFGEYCCLPLIDLCACTPPVSMTLRASVRNRYGIQVCGCIQCRMILESKINVVLYVFYHYTTTM